MDVRYVELLDPIERSVSEIYAALALDTPVFDSFETRRSSDRPGRPV